MVWFCIVLWTLLCAAPFFFAWLISPLAQITAGIIVGLTKSELKEEKISVYDYLGLFTYFLVWITGCGVIYYIGS